VSDQSLEVQYQSSFVSGAQVVTCIKKQKYEQLYYQGFFGLTAVNERRTQNDIDLKMVEFFNMNSHYYQETQGIEKKDYFAQENNHQ
jgi:hypothetical protein